MYWLAGKITIQFNSMTSQVVENVDEKAEINKNLMEQITDINYPVLEFKEAHDTIKIEKDEIATLGQTFHGFVCDTIVKSYKNGDDQYIEKLEIYYRTDLNDDHHGISVESMEKEQAMVAR